MDRDIITEHERELLQTPAARSSAVVNRAPGSLTDAASGTELPGVAPQPDNAIVQIHRLYVDVLGQAVGEMVRQPVTTRLRDDGLGTYSEFVFHQPVPTCCAVLSSSTVELELYCYLEPQILFSLLDRMLGSHTVDLPPARVLSEIEHTLAQLLLEQIASSYARMWEPTLALDLAVERIMHNAQQAKLLPGSEPCYMARYELSCGREFGQMEICLPWQATESIRQRIS